jgi:hypothetical protein
MYRQSKILGGKMYNNSWSLAGNCRMNLLFTVDHGQLLVLLVSPEEHLPPWSPLADWEGAEVPCPFYNPPCRRPLHRWLWSLSCGPHRTWMFRVICIIRVMALAIISHLKALNRSNRCEVIPCARFWGSEVRGGSVKLRTPPPTSSATWVGESA